MTTKIHRLFPLLCLLCCLAIQPVHACRYNVRETGFIDLGIESYYLFGFVNKDTPQETTSTFKQVLSTTLADTNLRAEIIDIDKQKKHPAIKFLNSAPAKSFPAAVLVSPDGRTLAVPLTKPNQPFKKTLSSAIDNILSSPKRNEILRKAAKTYGVALVIEGPNAQQNKNAKKAASTAIGHIKSQMDMLPKPISHPPELVVLDSNSLSTEKILLWSFGLDVEDVNEPFAAVFYGRARWIGPLFKGKQITENYLTEILFVIGADCECGFNYRWLQGTMLPAKWNQKLHKQAAESLGFDPENPMIKMEIASIIRRGMGGYYYSHGPPGYRETTVKPESDTQTTQITDQQSAERLAAEPNIAPPEPNATPQLSSMKTEPNEPNVTKPMPQSAGRLTADPNIDPHELNATLQLSSMKTDPNEPNVTKPMPQSAGRLTADPSPADIYSPLRIAAFLAIALFALVIILGIAILARSKRV